MSEISNDNAEYIDNAVRRGAYSNPTEALNEAVGLLKQRDQLRAEVRSGIDQANNGELLPASEVLARLEKRALQIEEAARNQR